MTNRLLSLILALVLAVSMTACSGGNVKPEEDTGRDPKTDAGLKVSFEQDLTELDENLDIWGSQFQWSPDGSYAIFDAMSSKPNAPTYNTVILADIRNNKLIKLADGYLRAKAGWSKDGKYVAFNAEEQLFLYNTADKTVEKVSDKGYMPEFSPDGSKFVYMNEGLWIYDIGSKSTSQVTKGKYDSAPIWFSDGKRVFFFRDNGKNLGDGAGNEQIMSVLDTSKDNVYIDFTFDAGRGKFRTARWLQQDSSIFIHAGWDDGNFYHILDIDNGKLIENALSEYAYTAFDDAGKRLLTTKGYNSSGVVELYNYDMKKLGTVSLDNDKEYPAAKDNIGIASIKGDRMIYLHTNQEANKGALMISYLSDGRQTKVTEYGDYSTPLVSPDGELLAYFENSKKLKVVPIDSLKETVVTKAESSEKAVNELLRMLPDRAGAEWRYNGYVEYGHSMRIDGINVTEDGKKQFLISGKVDDMSGGESGKDFDIYMEYLVSKEGIREIMYKGEVMPHKVKEFDMLRYPLTVGSTWTEQVEINGQKTELKAEILEEYVSSENNKIIKVQYTAKAAGMPNDTYREIRTFEEGKGLTAFENTFDKDYDFGYSLTEFKK